MNDSLRRRPWILPVLAAVAVHAPALGGAFVFDDLAFIERQGATSLAALGEVWRSDYGLQLVGRPLGYYRPALGTLLAVLRWLAGPSPAAFHLCSLALLAGAAALVTRVVLRLRPAATVAAVAAGVLYAVHPARVETVSLVTSLPDLLVELCALGLVLVWTAPRCAWAAGLAGAGLALVAACAKESAFFVVPAMAVTAGVCVARGDGAGRRGVLAGAAGALAALALVAGARVAAGVPAPVPLPAMLAHLVGDRSSAVLETLAVAARGAILPEPAVFWYQQHAPHGSAAALAGLVAVSAALAGLWLAAVQRRALWWALLAAWAGANAVNLALLTAADYPYAQRYLALAPLAAALGVAGNRLAHGLRLSEPGRERARALAGTVVGGYLLAQAAWGVAGTLTCLTPLRFFEAARAARPGDVVSIGAVAELRNARGEAAEVVEALVREATAAGAQHPQVSPLHNMLIKRYLADGRPADAARCAAWSLRLHTNDWDKVVLQAVAGAQLGQFAGAAAAMDRAVAAKPDNEAYRRLRQQMREAGGPQR